MGCALAAKPLYSLKIQGVIMKQVIVLATVIFLFLSLLNSCSKDESPNEPSSTEIKGLWKSSDPNGGGELLESNFKASGEYLFLKHESATEIDSAIGTYQLDGNSVTINTSGGWGNGVYKWVISNQNLTLTLTSGEGGDLSYYLTSVVWER